MTLDPDACYTAMTARDARFDGLFFVGVTTTGVYCRPVCTARTPRRDRCTFHASAARAEKAGFRACFLCKPEAAPGGSTVDAVPQLVARAAQRIDEGALNAGSVDDLAAELGVTARHLRRSMERELGVAPIELAQTRRLAFARQLLANTKLGVAEIAFASGFQSVRRFNAAFRAKTGAAPSSLRGRAQSVPGDLVLRLDVREPFDFERMLSFLRDREVPGVEHVAHDSYSRVVHLGDATGRVRVSRDPRRSAVRVEIEPSLAGHTMKIASRVRTQFDLDARPDIVDAALRRDPLLRPLVSARPGLRLPGAFDPFEATVRAMLGQQISVRAATTLAGRLVARFGAPVAAGTDTGTVGTLTHRFPTAAEVAARSVDEIASLGMPGARAETLLGLAKAVASGAIKLDGTAHADGTAAALVAMRGIGDWTAQYVCMRAMHAPDAFPAGDLGVRKALAMVSEREARARAEAWRPFRAYAVLHLWASLEAKGTK